jgi:hypothetical protein
MAEKWYASTKVEIGNRLIGEYLVPMEEQEIYEDNDNYLEEPIDENDNDE